MRGTTALGSGRYSNAVMLFMKWSNQLTGGTPLPYVTRSLGYPHQQKTEGTFRP